MMPVMNTPEYKGLSKVISGGQTGADQGGLLAAWKYGLQTGGTAPSNWHTENGKNPLLECLGLTAEGDYRSRTIKNVRDSDGTVLLSKTLQSPGSKLTRNEAGRQKKPFIEFDLTSAEDAWVSYLMGHIMSPQFNAVLQPFARGIADWAIKHRIGTLNVAGNREKGEGLTTTRAVQHTITAAIHILDAEGFVIRKL